MGVVMEKTDQMQFRVPAQLKEEFLKVATELDRPASQILRELMRSFISQPQNSRVAATAANDDLSDAEKRERANAVSSARASMALEGFNSSPEAKAMTARFINGEVSLEDCLIAAKKSLSMQ
jgi:predicted DNA-binding protein